MKVLVVERGIYEDQFVVSVCATWEAVNRLYPNEVWSDASGEGEVVWLNGKDYGDALMVTEMEVEE